MINLEIVQEIRARDNIVIAGHTNPDGDAIGACLSLAMALKKIGKNPVVLLEPYSRLYDFLPGQEYVKDQIDQNVSIDLFIALDCGDEGRLGEHLSIFKDAPRTINIDHHISNPLFGDLNFVHVESSSTCEIVYQIIKKMEIEIDLDIASAVYAGIVYDTGGFKHTNTTSRTHEIAGELLTCGIDSSYIVNRLFHTRSYHATKLLSRALYNISLCCNDQVCFSSLSKAEIEEAGCSLKDTEGIIKFIAEVEDIEVAVLIYERAANDVKVSLRSFGKIDVSHVASFFGGGGHVKASGCTLESSLDEARNRIIKILEDQLKQLKS